MAEEHELLESAEADPWAALLPGQELVPAYLASRYAAQYRVIVEVLLEEQDSSLTGLSYDDIAIGIRGHLTRLLDSDVADRLAASQHLDSRLERLEQWRVVTRWQQPARTGEDFLRRRDRYQLTPVAAELHTFWSALADADDATSDLTLAPRAIHDRLAAFGVALRAGEYQAAAAEFQLVTTVHQAMAKSARSWQRTLAHALSGGPDPLKQELLWDTLQSYIGAWGEQVDVHSPAIAELIDEIHLVLTDTVWSAIAGSSMADDAPDDLVASTVLRWRHTWSALGAWFAGADGQARRLRRQLRDLVSPWARNMHILMDTGGVVTRRADLLRLATAIEQAATDETALRIWDTAVGAFSARHLMIASASADDHTLPWVASPPAPVTARFREQGTRASVGKRPKAPDYSAGREAARRARAAALAARREAEASLRQRSGTRISTWGRVTDSELDLLLELVGTARRGAGDGDGGWVATTSDGRWQVALSPPPSAGDTAALDAQRGRLVVADWQITLEPSS